MAVLVHVIGCLTGDELCIVDLIAASTIHDIHVQIQENTGILEVEQRLYLNGRLLRRDELVGHVFDVCSDLTHVHVALRRVDPRMLEIIAQLEHGLIRYNDVDSAFKEDREVVLAAVQYDKNEQLLKSLSKQFRGDRDIVFAAVRRNVEMFWHASKELRGDRELLHLGLHMTSLRDPAHGLIASASPELRCDRETLMIIPALGLQEGDLKHDRELTMAAVSQSPRMLEHVADAFKNDREIVSLAVSRRGLLLRFAAEELKQDREIVLTAVRSKADALQFASESLRHDREIAEAAVHRHRIAFRYVPEPLKSDIMRTICSHG
mmetsp:Transcript_46925/g.84808  ORF Transcript_46925/g.84808 Transcript_46925/m.84808 type:complete len:321 (+) Transcript_46925:60-1022(+)